MVFSLTTVLCIVAAYLLYILQRKPKNYPPGPRNWPIVGTIPAMMAAPKDTPFDTFDFLAKKYGDVVGLFMGTKPFVVINGYECVKEISALEEFSYRPNIGVPQHKMFGYEKIGVFFTEGDKWRNQRRFTLRHLRDFGFGKLKMEQYIHDEVAVLHAAIDKETRPEPEAGLDVMNLLPAVAINTLWYIVAGERKDLDDERFVRLTQLVLKLFRLGDQDSPVPLYRLLQLIPGINSRFRQQEECGDAINNFVLDSIKEHIKTFDENHMRDFMDVYIKEMQEDQTGHFTINQLTAVCVDLFIAGTETTSSTIGFTLRYLIKHPEVQTKVREELHRVVGSDRLPSLEDIPNLPFCSAVLAESMRHSTLAAFAPPRAPAKDATFKGYHIPKRAMILVNMRSVLWDPKHWGDPENFRPERFIGPDGSYKKDEHLILFGTGMRYCLGEPFARNSAFIFYTALVQNYVMQIPPNGPVPSDVTLPGFTMAPESFKLTFMKI